LPLVADNSEALRQARQADTATRVARCETVLNRMVKAGETITVAKLARRAGVGEKFAFRHAVLKAKIDAAKQAVTEANGADLDAALAVERNFWKDRARQTEHRLERAVKRIAELEGKQVAEERGLVAPQDEVHELRARVAQLQATVSALETRVTRADRDVEAVRKLNRDLVRENTRLRDS